MKYKKLIIKIVKISAVFLILFLIPSCVLVKGIKEIAGGFQFGKPDDTGVSSCVEENLSDKTDEDNNKSRTSETLVTADNSTSPDTALNSYENNKTYPILSADIKGMKNKIETENYMFYFNNTDLEFLNTYIKIAEDGYKGIRTIFGKDLNSGIEIFLCEEFKEFKTVSDGIIPPEFEGNEPAGQSVNGAVHIFKAEDFKPGPDNIDEIINYKIALLHEIGHAYYFLTYKDASKKNDWFDEALADKSITGEYIDPYSISNDYLIKMIKDGNFVPLSKLEDKGVRTFDSDEQGIFSEYISLVNFVSLEFGFEVLNRLLEEYNGPNDFLTSIEKATNQDIGSFERQWSNAILEIK